MASKKPAQADPKVSDDPVVLKEPKPPAKRKAPAKPKRVKLTNKAGAGAIPLAKDVDAWIAKGWFRT